MRTPKKPTTYTLIRNAGDTDMVPGLTADDIAREIEGNDPATCLLFVGGLVPFDVDTTPRVTIGTAPSKPAPAKVAKAKQSPRRQRAAKGEPVDLDVLLAFVTKNPGIRAEQIAKHTDLDRGAIRVGLAKLYATGKVRSQGKARGTTYTATSDTSFTSGIAPAPKEKRARKAPSTRVTKDGAQPDPEVPANGARPAGEVVVEDEAQV